MHVSFQVLSIINDYWFIHRISVSFSGASTYNKLSRIMMLCCCTQSSLIQCNHNYMIPEYDALYHLKRQWYYEFAVILWVCAFLIKSAGNWYTNYIYNCDVARRYVHQTFGLEKHAFDRGSWFQYHINCYCIRSKIVWKCIIWEQNFIHWTSNISVIFNKCKSLNNGSVCALYLLL